MFNIAVFVSGSGTNLQAMIDQQNRYKSKICCVISNTKNAYALTRAKNHNIPSFIVSKKGAAGEEEIIDILESFDINLIVLAGYLRILGPTLINKYKGQIINIHPSLLPKYGGAGFYGHFVHSAVLDNHEKFSGATVHFVEEGIDTGKIILQRSLKIATDETPESLQARILADIEHYLLVDSILILEGEKLMKVLIVGNGGREAAICECINRQNDDVTLFCTRANPGIDAINVDISPEDVDAIVEFAATNDIDFTIVGPEVPLVAGISDKFAERGLKIFGPTKDCAMFEGSKKFTKEFLTKYNIPTAKYQSFAKTEIAAALEALKSFNLPVVIKADGLAAGKGVLICNDYIAATQAIKNIFNDTFKGAGESLVIEEYLDGVEASLLCFVDGNIIVPMETARDYKRIFDNDKGDNTGGMGGFSPNPIINDKLNLNKTILEPIINGFKEENLDFRGVLFIGLMIVNNIPYVLEFNVRFGDPETQSVLPRLKTNLLDVLQAVSCGSLDKINLEWDKRCSVTVVLASEGYPAYAVSARRVISGLDTVDGFVFQAGTKQDGADIIVSGGRVLAVTTLADSVAAARDKVYHEVQKVSFDGMQYRQDIAII